MEDLRVQSSAFIDDHYNRQRLQSALGYVSPGAFEEAISGRVEPAAQLSFEKHEEIYPMIFMF